MAWKSFTATSRGLKLQLTRFSEIIVLSMDLMISLMEWGTKLKYMSKVLYGTAEQCN